MTIGVSDVIRQDVAVDVRVHKNQLTGQSRVLMCNGRTGSRVKVGREVTWELDQVLDITQVLAQ